MTNIGIYVTFQDMRKFIIFSVIITLAIYGCSTLPKKKVALTHGMSQEEVIAAWANPGKKVSVGATSEGYPVEVWEYDKATLSWLKKTDYFILIFVDGELYSWADNDPSFAVSELTELGVLKQEYIDFGLQDYQRRLRESAEQAEQTRKTMETLRSYQNYKNTQMQIQNQQRMRIFQQPPLNTTPLRAPNRTNRQ